MSKNSLMLSISDAIRIHDAAHKLSDKDLHDVAVRCLKLCGIPHVNTKDKLDIKDEETELWQKLPGAICLLEEAVSVAEGESLQLIAEEEVLREHLLECVPRRLANVLSRGQLECYDRIPAYELWLIKKEKPSEAKKVRRFEVGKFIETHDDFRRSGAYQFPVIAMPLPDNYTLVQIHKKSDTTIVFDREGKTIDVNGCLEGEVAIYEGLLVDGNVIIYDVIQYGDIDCTVLPLLERRKFLPKFLPTDDWILVEDSNGLLNLPQGKYLIRHVYDKVDDLKRPFWFLYEAKAVKVGQPLPWLSPHASESVEKVEGEYTIPVPKGTKAQIHKKGNNVMIFLDGGGKDKSQSLISIAEAFTNIEAAFIIECVIQAFDAEGEIVDYVLDKQAENYRIYCYDIAFFDGVLVDIPLSERVQKLKEFIEKVNCEWVVNLWETQVESNTYWQFLPDHTRPVDSKVDYKCVELRI